MIDTYLLEQLVAVRQHGTLIAAADSLSVSQPALSKSMTKLEVLMDIPLFVRTNRKIELNQTGRFFADRAADFLAQGESLMEQVYAFDRNLRNVSVGSCAPIPLWELTPALSSLFPDMSVTTQTADDAHLLKGLSQHFYQIIVTNTVPESDDLYSYKFKTETMFLSVPQAHPFYKRMSVKPEELNGQLLIVYNEIGVWNTLIREHFPGIRLMTVNDTDALRDAIDLGAALSFASDYVVKLGYHNREQKIIPLEMEDNSVSYYLVCKKKDYTKYRKLFNRFETEHG